MVGCPALLSYFLCNTSLLWNLWLQFDMEVCVVGLDLLNLSISMHSPEETCCKACGTCWGAVHGARLYFIM